MDADASSHFPNAGVAYSSLQPFSGGACCDWRDDRCIVITPNHETEAWVLADPQAGTSSLGYVGDPATLGLPAHAAAAERLRDPKATLVAAVAQVRGRRRDTDLAGIYPAVAQGQRLEALRRSASFRLFEDQVRAAMTTLGCL